MIDKLHFISAGNTAQDHLDVIENACLSGCKLVQLRVKSSNENLLNIAIKAKEICDKFGSKLIMNDHIDIAKKVNAYGVHLGLNDTSIKVAREFLGNKFVIGGTANTYEDIIYHHQQGADYVGVGPLRFTETKKNLSPVLGVEGYRNIITKCKEGQINIPIIAIGGILETDFEDLKLTGIFGIAISGLIINAENKKSIVESIYRLF